MVPVGLAQQGSRESCNLPQQLRRKGQMRAEHVAWVNVKSSAFTDEPEKQRSQLSGMMSS